MPRCPSCSGERVWWIWLKYESSGVIMSRCEQLSSDFFEVLVQWLPITHGFLRTAFGPPPPPPPPHGGPKLIVFRWSS
ncbi:unnamed protein product [Nippostrongylus brasiliensis]|uniref:Uncharacterized protein n=1 Tax=Nippostrongylus brasiliensis TaxID=27835 RepID=A0A0N4YRG2_NIPBR|nr:unnamed protein product [Nippostrongylus brasiliensis]